MIKIMILSRAGLGRSTIAAHVANWLRAAGFDVTVADGDENDVRNADKLCRDTTTLYRQTRDMRLRQERIAIETQCINRVEQLHHCYEGQVATSTLGVLAPCPKCKELAEEPHSVLCPEDQAQDDEWDDEDDY